MASSHCNVPSEPAKIEQIITEFFAKTLHIILESRSPCVSSRNFYSNNPYCSSSSSTSSIRPRDKWFNLALRECPSALENLELWRQSNLELLVVDVILISRSAGPEVARVSPGGCLLRNLSAKEHYPNCWSPGQDELNSNNRRERVIERWIVQYESRKSGGTKRDTNAGNINSSERSSNSPEIPASYKKIYKRSVLLVRSLYATVRLLPAHKIFRDLNSSGQINPFSLTHKISSFVEPFTRSEDAEMSQFTFVPIETPCGRLCLSVSYLPTVEDVCSQPSTPLSTQIIMDYVGSPLADPLKRLQSLPTAGPAPFYVSFTRRHSWSYDYGPSPSVSSSPSPTYSDSHAVLGSHIAPTQTNLNVDTSAILAPTRPILRNTSLPYNRSTSYDEYYPSPSFSPSSSPSPPHLPTSDPFNAPLHTESSPVKIPSVGRSKGSHNHPLPPSPSPKNTRTKNSLQANCTKNQVPGASSKKKPELLNMGDFQTGATLQKFSFGKDEAGLFSCSKLPPYSSPRLSRSSSRMSLADEYDESDISCPFAIDDEDIRTEPSDGKGNAYENLQSEGSFRAHKSKHAAVGALVTMLKTAAPLRQDLSDSVKASQVCKGAVWNEGSQSSKNLEPSSAVSLQNAGMSSKVSVSALFRSRTTADAFEELRSYKEMKDLLLGDGEPKPSDSTQ